MIVLIRQCGRHNPAVRRYTRTLKLTKQKYEEMIFMSFWDLPYLEQVRIIKEIVDNSIAARIALYLSIFLLGLGSIIWGIASFEGGGRTFLIVVGITLWAIVAIDTYINIRKNRFYW